MAGRQQFGDYGGGGFVVHTFERVPAWKWRIKIVTFAEELEHEKVFTGYEITNHPDGRITRRIEGTDADILVEEIFLTFDGTNIPGSLSTDPEDCIPIEKVRPGVRKLFMPVEVSKNRERFLELLGRMPTSMVREVWMAVRRANPQWVPGFPQLYPDTSAEESLVESLEGEPSEG